MRGDKMAGVKMREFGRMDFAAPVVSRRRFIIGGLVTALMVASSLTPIAAFAWYEPRRGSAERSEILDALRPAIEAEMRGPVEFVIQQFRASDGWAFVIADPQRPGGGVIDVRETAFADDADMMDGLRVYALCRWSGERWNLIEHSTGPTDVVFEPWPRLYGAPAEIFGF